jgi:hypothetical protein
MPTKVISESCSISSCTQAILLLVVDEFDWVCEYRFLPVHGNIVDSRIIDA